MAEFGAAEVLDIGIDIGEVSVLAFPGSIVAGEPSMGPFSGGRLLVFNDKGPNPRAGIAVGGLLVVARRCFMAGGSVANAEELLYRYCEEFNRFS